MAFFEKPVLFSEVTGVVMINGRPLANVEVNRQLKHFELTVADSTVTDSDGRFKLKTIYRKWFQLYDILPHQVVILQQITFKHNGKDYDGYFNQKMNYLNNGELKGKPISLLCDLNNKYVDNDGLFMGICRLRKRYRKRSYDMEPLSPRYAALISEHAYKFIDRADRVAGIEGYGSFGGSMTRFVGVSGCGVFQKEAGFGYVAKGSGARNGEALIAIRGTSPFADWLTDFTVSREEGPSGDLVHAGFNRVFKSFREEIDRSLNSIGPSAVHIVGHSLGGALANLTADYVRQRGVAVKVYTFGAPRTVTNAPLFSQNLGDQNIYRVYHTADPVSMVPIFPFQPVPSTNWGHFIYWNGAAGFSPHFIANYVRSVGEMDWSGVRAHTVTTRGWWQRQTKEWLEGAIPGDFHFMMGSGMALWTIVFALEQVIDDIGWSLNNAVIAGGTVLDRLAQLLYTGTLQSPQIADKVRRIMSGILSFMGRTIDKTTTLTVAFIKWVLETLHRVVSTAALAAVCATFRH